MAESISAQTAREMKISALRSSQVLSMKDQELSSLREQLKTLKEKCEHHVNNLVQEVDFLMSYATSLWTIIHKMEKYQYPVTVINGLKAFQIPSKDKIDSPLASPRVLKLKLCSEKAQEYVLQLNQQYDKGNDLKIPEKNEAGSEHSTSHETIDSRQAVGLGETVKDSHPGEDESDLDQGW